jgi:hypothetical protein
VSGLIGQPETANPYVFNRNNPAVWVDPTGEMSLLEIGVVVGIIAVAAAVALPNFASNFSRLPYNPLTRRLKWRRFSGHPGRG